MRGLVLSACLFAAASPASAQQPVIRSEADLPTTRYPHPEVPSASYLGDRFRDEIMPAARRDAERILATHRIEDPSIASLMRVGLASIAILQNRPEDAQRLIREARAAAPKPQTRAVGWFTHEAAARAGAGGCTAARDVVARTVANADPLVVRDDIVGRYGSLQSVSPGYHAATLAFALDGEVKVQRSLDLQGALLMANVRMEALTYPRCRAEMTAPLRAWLDDPRNKPTNIWPARAVPAAALAGARPVTVAVWEAGYDPSVFPGQLAFDPAEPLDGRDNDGNGVVDDAFGPTFDPYLRPTATVNQPLTDALAARLPLQLALMKGELDLGYGDNTPEARLFAQRSRDATPAEQIEDALTYREVRGRSHATYVASLIADGGPFVRLYNLQSAPFGDDPEPVAMDEDSMARWEATLPAAAARMARAGVRVVNMSWGSDADELAQKLLARGLEKDPARARTRGAALQRRVVALLERTMRAHPDVLFIAAAGNSNQSDAILASAPSSMREPNLLVVGATGVTGRPTEFTTFGDNVRLYALGEGNAVRGLGGMRLRASGTSFAAPETARVAAQMLAVQPGLTPAQVIEGLLASATREESGLTLIHPAQAIAWARARRP